MSVIMQLLFRATDTTDVGSMSVEPPDRRCWPNVTAMFHDGTLVIPACPHTKVRGVVIWRIMV